MNNKKWNRVLTGAATVALAIGTLAPMAFAATSSGTQYNTRTINVGQGYTAVVSGVVAQDQGHATEFLPIYYLDQGLGKLGYTVNWNGNTRTLNITTPAGVTVQAPTTAVGAPGAGQMVIQLNGTNVQLAPRVVAKDPGSGVYTTFVPIFYIDNALQLAGFTNAYNGTNGTWNVTAPASAQASSQASLSSITVANETNGTGTITSPAVSLTGAAMKLSTTLTDASGNPMPNVGVTFTVSNYGNSIQGFVPTVQNASGTIISGTASNGTEQYVAYTDTQGVASITMTGPSGTTYAYEVVATAPYSNASGATITSQPTYVEFVANNTAGITPYAVQGQPYTAALGSIVPLTVILPPSASGQPQANVLLTLNVTQNGLNPPQGVFTTASGVSLATTIQVATNSQGIAQAYLGAADVTNSGDPLEVTVTPSSLPTGVNAPSGAYFSFVQGGVGAKIGNFSITSTSANIGQTVYVSGQLQDAAGNPVPNGQLLVTAANDQSGNAFSYVSGTTTTAFPVLGSSYATLGSGTQATSAYGDLISTDSAGNFNFGLTDSRIDNGANSQTYDIYSVSNGGIANNLSGSIPAGDNTIAFNQSTSLADLSIGQYESYVTANSSTSLTGLSAQIDAGGILQGQLQSPSPYDTVNQDNGVNPQIADVYVEPQNSAGHHNGALNQAETYTLTASNGGQIYSINGVPITPATSVTLQYTPQTSGNYGGYYTVSGFTDNGAPLTISSFPTNGGVAAIGTGSGSTWNPTNGVAPIGNFDLQSGSLSVSNANPEDFEVGVINGNAGDTTLTVSSGSVSSTAQINYTGASPAQAANATVNPSTLSFGSTTTVTFQVQDANGNPVSQGTAVNIGYDNSATDPIFVTGVNGAPLQESLNMQTTNGGSTQNYTTVSTPIPLGQPQAVDGNGNNGTHPLNYSVSIQDVASWSNTQDSSNKDGKSVQANATNTFTAYTGANGDVSLTLQVGDVSYPTQYDNTNNVSGNLATPSALTSSTVPNGVVGIYTDTSGNSAVPIFIGSASGASSVDSKYSQIGSITWGNNPQAVVSGNQTVTFSPTSTPASFQVPTSGTYTVNVPSSFTGEIDLTGGSGSTNLTINAANAKVVNNLGTQLNYLQIDPASFTNKGTIDTLEITQNTSLTVDNTGTIAQAIVAPASGATSTPTITFSGTAPAAVYAPSTGVTVSGATVITSTVASTSGYSAIVSGTHGTTTTITGIVTDSSGNPVPSYNVVVGIGSAQSASVTTNSEGSFTAFVPTNSSAGSVTVNVYVYSSGSSQPSSPTLSPAVTLS